MRVRSAPVEFCARVASIPVIDEMMSLLVFFWLFIINGRSAHELMIMSARSGYPEKIVGLVRLSLGSGAVGQAFIEIVAASLERLAKRAKGAASPARTSAAAT